MTTDDIVRIAGNRWMQVASCRSLWRFGGGLCSAVDVYRLPLENFSPPTASPIRPPVLRGGLPRLPSGFTGLQNRLRDNTKDGQQRLGILTWYLSADNFSFSKIIMMLTEAQARDFMPKFPSELPKEWLQDRTIERMEDAENLDELAYDIEGPVLRVNFGDRK
ncbi:hypothetical protein MSG28_016079 [Choristoneura fumiferana]|uniref:Uncharacterized protein n=1 Tax=Choristoneura fumiferana TaxID=7141 RepID=A0ACC0K5Q4_CHOFU|nr:hypothetical protein MSG28_016079 [Choristoneura fumiferana]